MRVRRRALDGNAVERMPMSITEGSIPYGLPSECLVHVPSAPRPTARSLARAQELEVRARSTNSEQPRPSPATPQHPIAIPSRPVHHVVA